jgi:hypothetical protein
MRIAEAAAPDRRIVLPVTDTRSRTFAESMTP